MSDNSNSTGSTGSSTNSWTLLSPEEAAVENLGAVDDGTESLGDVPSLSEELAGAAMEIKSSEIPIETVLSEEGHEVCQETSPESSVGPVPSSPSLSPHIPPTDPFLPLDYDTESQPPVIHDMVTSSPGDNDQLGATPFVTNIGAGAELDIPFTEPLPEEIELDVEPEPQLEPESSPAAPFVPEFTTPAEPVLDTPTDTGPVAETPVVECVDPVTELEVSIPAKTLNPSEPPSSHIDASVSPASGSSEDLPSPVTETTTPEVQTPKSSAPETVVSETSEAPEAFVSEASVPEAPAPEGLVSEAPVPEALVSNTPAPEGLVSEASAPETIVSETSAPEGLVSEVLEPEALVSAAPEIVGPNETEEEEPAVEKDEIEKPEKVTQAEEEEAPVQTSSSFDFTRIRRRNVPFFEAPRPRTSDDDDDDDEEEEEDAVFELAQRKEEKRGFSMNKCIIGALVVLCLGSLFLSDDSDPSELSDGEQNQGWLNGDPQYVKELLEKLAQENQQISQLEAQLQSQKEGLDLALKTAAAAEAVAKDGENVRGDVEKENQRMKEELSSLPGLKEELETLRARVTELTQLTANPATPAPSTIPDPQPGPQPEKSSQSGAAAGPEEKKKKGDYPRDGSRMKEELQRQKVLLEESRKRLEGMKKREGGAHNKKGVRDSLEEIQKRLSEQVDKLDKKKPWESKWTGNKGKDSSREHWKKEEKKEWRGEKETKHSKDREDSSRDHWKKEEKKEWRGEKDTKHSKDGGWREKDERRDDWKQHKQNSHKEAWRRNQEEWERKKDERKMDRDNRRKEKIWQKPKTSNGHHQNHQNHRQSPRQFNHDDFWKHQGAKLRRIVGPLGCGSVDDCAAKEGLYPVELLEFEELLEGYLSKLEGSPAESKDEIRRLTAEFFKSGVFTHDRVLFADFAEDVADILEDMADVLEDDGPGDNDRLENEMEEFEREALWKFSATA